MQSVLIVVLLQRSEGGALGIGGGGGGGGGGGLFTPRGAGDALTRITAVLAVLFFLTSMGLTLLALHAKPQRSILDSAPTKPATAPLTKKPQNKPAAPEVPTVPSPQH
jgi:preprotein translocase subunit SecG